MPNICFQNGLDVSDVPDCLKLTDLENQLISKNLIFIKVHPSPRSRYGVMNDRIVNVPIPDDDIIKTVSHLPRSNANDGLIHVQLKRKVEYHKVENEQQIRCRIWKANLSMATNFLSHVHTTL